MVTVGFDLRALQIGHAVRGIGEVTRSVLRGILSQQQATQEDFDIVFFQFCTDKNVVDSFIDSTAGKTVEIPDFKRGIFRTFSPPMLPDQEEIVKSNCDIFFQFDPSLGVPSEHKNVLVYYDSIPYILGNEFPQSYFSTYRVARRSGLSLRPAVANGLKRYRYKKRAINTISESDIVLGISGHTIADIADLTGIERDYRKMHLGHIAKGANLSPKSGNQRRFISDFSGQGIICNGYIFFMGGVDQRRRIEDMIHAFDWLKSQGSDIKLVLAGESFFSAEDIPQPEAKAAILLSQYFEDIVFLGYCSDEERIWLYKNALAFIFPSIYEGFGLPIVESLALSCPAITYDNTSLKELTGPNVYVADSWLGIADNIQEIQALSPDESAARKSAGREFASQFTWDKAAQIANKAIHDLIEHNPA